MTSIDHTHIPAHVAIIMDGNGRWARKRGMKRFTGHQKGAEAVRQIVRTSHELGIQWLTLYAFSEENWKRPRYEIQALMKLLVSFLTTTVEEMQENGIRLRSIGRIEKLPRETALVLGEVMEKTSSNEGMTLTLALSYGGRQELVDAFTRMAQLIQDGTLAPGAVNESVISECLDTSGMPEPDLLIRTSGEYRVSNFLLWQIAYAELYFTPCLWPDFGREEYLAAIEAFQHRERRFGATT